MEHSSIDGISVFVGVRGNLSSCWRGLHFQDTFFVDFVNITDSGISFPKPLHNLTAVWIIAKTPFPVKFDETVESSMKLCTVVVVFVDGISVNRLQLGIVTSEDNI